MDSKDKQQAQTIATIDVNIEWNHRERFIEDHTTCPLCGTEMLITHVTHFVQQTVKEEAHCEKCNIKVRDNQHALQ